MRGRLEEAVVAAILGLVLSSQPSPQELTREAVEQDFKAFHTFIAQNYAYFDQKTTDWRAVPGLYARELDAVKTRRDLLVLLERVIEELYDHHAHLTANTATSPRLVPAGTDLWAEWRNGRAVIGEVRPDSDAERGGVTAGATVRSINGVPIERAVEERLGRSLSRRDDNARSWALRSILAGRRGEARTLVIDRNGSAITIDLPGREQEFGKRDRLVAEIRPGGHGYIRLNDSLGDRDVIADFDAALERLRQAPALILDLRHTPSGGNTTVARAILGRFVKEELPYQKHSLPSETRDTGVMRSWLELVSPRGAFRYERPVAVLVSHWTGSMGEGLAMGFDATGSGVVVGTPMAGLLGATYRLELPNSKLGVNVPAEKLFHVNGTPRERFIPPIAVQPRSAAAGDAWIAAADKALARSR